MFGIFYCTFLAANLPQDMQRTRRYNAEIWKTPLRKGDFCLKAISPAGNMGL